MTDNGNSTAPATKAPPKPLRVTSAREWRKMRLDGVLVELPSGLVARLRPVGLMDLWRANKIPDALTGLVAELIVNQTYDPEKSQMTGELIGVIADLYNIVCTAAFVSPAIVEHPSEDADEIQIEDVSLGDRQFVLAWASAPTNELKPFSDEQGQQNPPMEPMESVASVQRKTKPTD